MFYLQDFISRFPYKYRKNITEKYTPYQFNVDKNKIDGIQFSASLCLKVLECNAGQIPYPLIPLSDVLHHYANC